MGVDYNTLTALLYARRRGVDFSRTLMIGRQQLLIAPAEARKVFARFEWPCSATNMDAIFASRYAEPLLGFLGAREIASLDASPYEGASIIHDLNRGIPSDLEGVSTFTFDGGSLEHIFNVPISTRNLMRLTQTGGHVLSVTPANNFLGHGFYQFSPELFYRIFSAPNGFSVDSLYLCERISRGRWQAVTDPEMARRRVTLINCRETYMVTLALKIGEGAGDLYMPQQSDYDGAYYAQPPTPDEDAPPSETVGLRARRIVMEGLPDGLLWVGRAIRDRMWRRGYREGFAAVDPVREADAPHARGGSGGA